MADYFDIILEKECENGKKTKENYPIELYDYFITGCTLMKIMIHLFLNIVQILKNILS